jgi:hypothetical protein
VFSISNQISANDYFLYNTQYYVAICKIYEYAVIPGDIVGYLSKRNSVYCVPESIARQIKEIIVNKWDEVHNKPSMFPTHVEKPIEGLTVHNNSIKCSFYVYVCRSSESIRKY